MNHAPGPAIRVSKEVATLIPVYLRCKGVAVKELDRFRAPNRNDLKVDRFLCGGRCNSMLMTISHLDEHPADTNFIHASSKFRVLLPYIRFNLNRNAEPEFLGMLTAFQWIVEEGDAAEKEELFAKYKLGETKIDP